MDTFERRLQTLERDLQRSRWTNRALFLAVIATICIAGAQGIPQDAPKLQEPSSPPATSGYPADREPSQRNDRLRTIEAGQFVLLDRLGRARAKMSIAEGGPELSMFDEDGRKRLEIKQAEAASGLRFFGDGGSPALSLQLPHAEPAQLEIRGSRATSVTNSDGLFVRDADDRGRVHLALLNGNFPVLGISQDGQTGPPSVELTAAGGSRSLKLHDREGHPLVSLFAAEDGKTFLTMRHPDHERSLQISAGPKDLDGPTIAILAPANKDGSGGLLPRLRLGLTRDCQPYLNLVGSDGRPLFAAPSQ